MPSMSQKFKSLIEFNTGSEIWAVLKNQGQTVSMDSKGISLKQLHNNINGKFVEFVDGSIYRHPHWSM